MLEIEYVKPEPPAKCECCGGKTYWLTRFVKKDGDAHAVYYASFTENHSDKLIRLAISLGEWWLDDSPQRRCFSIAYRETGETNGLMATDPSESPWNDVARLGKMLTRQEALSDPEIHEVWHITDHIFTEDPQIIRFLQQKPA